MEVGRLFNSEDFVSRPTCSWQELVFNVRSVTLMQ